MEHVRHGPSSVLTEEEESELVSWVVKMAEIRYGQTRIQVTEMVKTIDQTGRPNPFQDNRLGKDWWYMFLHRHPKASLKTPQDLQILWGSSCRAEVMDKWYRDYEPFLQASI